MSVLQVTGPQLSKDDERLRVEWGWAAWVFQSFQEGRRRKTSSSKRKQRCVWHRHGGARHVRLAPKKTKIVKTSQNQSSTTFLFQQTTWWKVARFFEKPGLPLGFIIVACYNSALRGPWSSRAAPKHCPRKNALKSTGIHKVCEGKKKKRRLANITQWQNRTVQN